jgi:hypothetical protein
MWGLPFLAPTRGPTQWVCWGAYWPQAVLHMCGTISCDQSLEFKTDMYFYRDPENIEKEKQLVAEKTVTKEQFQDE